MTEEERAVVRGDAPDEYGTREEVHALALRIQATPLGKGFTQEEVWGIAQYARVMDLNPFRGEFYPMRGRDGKVHMVDGYKALVRWAKHEAAYSDDYKPLELKDGELFKFRCFILRDDRLAMIQKYKDLGATFKEAYELVAVYSDGTVRESETFKRDGTPIDPPKGWTWKQVARKRALKNALNLSHGAPSPREIAQASYIVNGTETTLEDWEGTEELKYPEERERLALMRAQERERRVDWESLSADEQQAKLKENTDLMRAPEDFEGFGDEPGTEAAERAFRAGAAAAAEAELKRMTNKVGQPTTQPGPPGIQDQPASQKRSTVLAQKWNVEATAFCQEEDYYNLPNGDPNWPHLTAAAFIMGYPEITDANLKEVIEALALYAEDQQALASENEATSKNIDAELIEGVIDGGQAMQDALGL